MSKPLERLLDWERDLLRSETLDQWLECAVRTPDGAPARLLLADPTHEVRPLLHGSREASGMTPASAVHCVASLTGLAPDLPAMRSAWRGEFHAADHALLLPGAGAARHVAILPLQRAGHLVGLYTAAADDAPPFASLESAWLDHAADVVMASLDRHLDRARILRGGLVDPLTGWNSQRYLQARLREEIARAQRERGSVSCLVADVDRLQALNDDLGYGAGDRALQELASRIESQVRSSDATARIGSDAFGVVLPATDAAMAVPLAERILAAVRSAPVDTGLGTLRELRVSIGIAGCRPQPGQDRKMLGDQLVADAVAALHRAKRAGGDRHEIQPG
jgi:two-component system cell cycle response regulator